MLKGELNSRGHLRGDLTGGIFYGTNDYEDLINKPQVNGVTLSGNKTTTDLGIIIPDKTSDLTNDSGFLTSSDVAAVAISGDYDDLTNKPTIPENLSDLVNDEGFIGFTEVTGTLLTGATSITLSDASITTTSTIDIYTDVFGIQPTNAVVASGSITLTFLAQASNITVKVRVS